MSKASATCYFANEYVVIQISSVTYGHAVEVALQCSFNHFKSNNNGILKICTILVTTLDVKVTNLLYLQTIYSLSLCIWQVNHTTYGTYHFLYFTHHHSGYLVWPICQEKHKSRLET